MTINILCIDVEMVSFTKFYESDVQSPRRYVVAVQRCSC